MKKIKIFLLTCFLCLPLNIQAVDQQTIKTNSEHMILVNMNDDLILYDKQMNDVIPMNSLTRLVTLATAIEHRGSYKASEELPFDDLLSKSLYDDEALLDLVNRLGGESRVVEWMNEKVKQLGLLTTHFINVTGLATEGQVTTLQEYTQLIREELKSPEFYNLLTQSNNSFLEESKKQDADTQYLLGGIYLNGNSLSLHQKNGLTLLCISVQSYDGSNIMDNYSAVSYYFKNYEWAKVIDIDENIASIPVRWGSGENQLNFIAQQDYYALLPINYNQEDLIKEVVVATTLEAPISSNQYVGEFRVSYSNEVVLTIPLFSNLDIERSDVHYNFDLVVNWASQNRLVMLGISVLALSSIIIMIKVHKKK